jgi:hypothetical protein
MKIAHNNAANSVGYNGITYYFGSVETLLPLCGFVYRLVSTTLIKSGT